MTDNPFDIPVEEVNEIFNDISPQLMAHFKNELLDNEIYQRLQTIYIPLACWINQQHLDIPIVIGVNGALGAGKSTLVRLLKIILEHGFNKKVLNLSIDDMYYSRTKRLSIADEIHPLFATRGVPGTHDVKAGICILEQCRSGNSGEIQIPVFDKSIDDLKPEGQWPTINLPVDIVLFEGWFVGARPQTDEELLKPVNQLEKEEDPDAIWRNYVNEQLKGDYQQLFSLIDKLIMMKVPSMAQVMQWRNQQEEKLSASINPDKDSTALMSKEEISRFILHDERLIRHQLAEMPDRADIVLEIGEDHQVCDIKVHRI